MRFLVAFLGHFVDIHSVRVLTWNSAKELIWGNVPPILWHADVSHLMLLLGASIDGGPILLLHVGVA